MESSSPESLGKGVEILPCPSCSFPLKLNTYVYPVLVIDFEESKNAPDDHKNLWRLSCQCSEIVWLGNHDTVISNWNTRARHEFIELTTTQYIQYKHYKRYGVE